MAGSMRRFKWFWAWEDEKEEAWLREMSRSGFHLSSVRPFGVYSFYTGDRMEFVYRLDYRINRKERQDYLRLLRDGGWEHISEMSGWQYFRKQVKEKESPEIFPDADLKIAKYRRLLSYLIIFFPVYIIIFSIAFINPPYSWWDIFRIIVFVLLLVWSYTIIRILFRIRQLKNS